MSDDYLNWPFDFEPDWHIVRCLRGRDEADRMRAAWQAEQAAKTAATNIQRPSYH